MGYVGCVSAACLAQSGHNVVGVDVSEHKLDILRKGKSPIVEPGIEELIAEQVSAGRLTVTSDVADAVANSDISIICVGTPSNNNGSLNLSYVQAVCEQIGAAIPEKDSKHIVVVRSTMLPGSVHECVIPALKAGSGDESGNKFSVAINPEFLRESTAISDYREPPFTLIGADDNHTMSMVGSLYSGIDAQLLEVGIREAEMVKYTCNCFHGLKVAFANEIGRICKAADIDSHVVMDAFCHDNKLNISPYYLTPGFAFGGSCLPKDLRALNYKARTMDVDVPVLQSVLPSNKSQVSTVFDRIKELGNRKIAFLGLSFKVGTDDLRESPMVTLAEQLIGKGYELQIYDKEVQLSKLVGANKLYIDSEIPHLSSLLNASLEDTIEFGETIVICKQDQSYSHSLDARSEQKKIVDLVRLNGMDQTVSGYDGLSW